MHEDLSKVLNKHGIKTCALTQHPSSDYLWTLETNPPPTAELIKDFDEVFRNICEVQYRAMNPPEAPYEFIGTATEEIPVGARVEYCASKGLCRKER